MSRYLVVTYRGSKISTYWESPTPICLFTIKLFWCSDYDYLYFFESGTNRKRICDFLLVRHSNLGPILHRFGDIAGFLCS